MATLTTGRDSSYLLDPHLFTFKPKLNQKSNEIAQNLLSDFYQRQLQHVKRLQELQEAAAGDYHQWYSRDRRRKRQKNPTENKSVVTTSDELNVADEQQNASATVKDVQPPNERLDRLFRIYRSPVPRKAGLPSIVTEPRPVRTLPRRSAPPAAAAAAAAASTVTVHAQSAAPPSAPIPHPTTAPSAPPVVTRVSRRMSPTNRSKSPPKSSSKVIRATDSSPKRNVAHENINTERLKMARDEAERAMKDHKIFTIIGPYPALREALRRRGWIEKFDRVATAPNHHGSKKSDKKQNRSDDDDDDDDIDDLADDALDESPMYDDDEIPPWEENDGYYGILSRLVKTVVPDFIWTVQASYDTSTLNRDQMVNHYSRNGCLTTKVGLCSSLRNLPWFHEGSADDFYPRCYKLTHDDDKVAFVDDYRLTSCISFLKLVQNRSRGILEPDMNSILSMNADNLTESSSSIDDEQSVVRPNLPAPPRTPRKKVPSTWIEFALKKVEQFTLARDHEDIDPSVDAQNPTTDEQWTQFIDQFYAASHSYAEIENMDGYLSKVDHCLKNVEQHWPQYHIDGTRNIWILKPGAKSRGRGIVVYDRLDDILKLCSSNLINDRKFVVQKYIERPLLIHNTKFDIRQWFLVTDWNPLTIWMFKDCYLRFCTEHFSLATRQQSVHLCNYSIQKHFKNNSNRHADLPVENMWTNREFIEKYLRPHNMEDKWENLIYPAMKDAIICSMLVAQDSIDPRKNSFELFGADFMLGEDLKPWLIEINCSPTMARCTAVTTEMCDSVLEDTCKVMIDRRNNRTSDTGRFELIHKGTPVPVPIYVGIDLRVEGKTYKSSKSNNKLPVISIDHDNSVGDADESELSSDSSREKFPNNRLTVDVLPIQPLQRSKIQERPPSVAPGNKYHREINSSGTIPLFRRFQKSWSSQRNKESRAETKLLQRQKSNLNILPLDPNGKPSTPSTVVTDNDQTSIVPLS